MSTKKCLDVLDRAEKAGVKIVVDADLWDGDGFPLDGDISPPRCELVAEARRIANTLDRPDAPPEGCVYRHTKETLCAALARATDYIATHMEDKTDAKSSKPAAKASESDAGGSSVQPDGDTDDGSADGVGSGKAAKTQGSR